MWGRPCCKVVATGACWAVSRVRHGHVPSERKDIFFSGLFVCFTLQNKSRAQSPKQKGNGKTPGIRASESYIKVRRLRRRSADQASGHEEASISHTNDVAAAQQRARPRAVAHIHARPTSQEAGHRRGGQNQGDEEGSGGRGRARRQGGPTGTGRRHQLPVVFFFSSNRCRATVKDRSESTKRSRNGRAAICAENDHQAGPSGSWGTAAWATSTASRWGD